MENKWKKWKMGTGVFGRKMGIFSISGTEREKGKKGWEPGIRRGGQAAARRGKGPPALSEVEGRDIGERGNEARRHGGTEGEGTKGRSEVSSRFHVFTFHPHRHAPITRRTHALGNGEARAPTTSSRFIPIVTHQSPITRRTHAVGKQRSASPHTISRSRMPA
jgi:hypothetical protein